MGFVGTPLQYGPNGERIDLHIVDEKVKHQQIHDEINSVAAKFGLHVPFYMACGASLLVLAVNCEFYEPLNIQHAEEVISLAKSYRDFYNWAFVRSRKIMNCDVLPHEDGDFGYVSLLSASEKYNNFIIHLENFINGIDSDYDELYNHIRSISGPQQRYAGDYTYFGGE